MGWIRSLAVMALLSCLNACTPIRTLVHHFVDLAHPRTAAFVVPHEDRVVPERYGRGDERQSLLNSFCVLRAAMSTLVEIALSEGRMAGLDTRPPASAPGSREPPTSPPR